MISITLSILPQSLAPSVFFGSAAIHASVSDKKLIKSYFNAGQDSTIVYFISRDKIFTISSFCRPTSLFKAAKHATQLHARHLDASFSGRQFI